MPAKPLGHDEARVLRFYYSYYRGRRFKFDARMGRYDGDGFAQQIAHRLDDRGLVKRKNERDFDGRFKWQGKLTGNGRLALEYYEKENQRG